MARNPRRLVAVENMAGFANSQGGIAMSSRTQAVPADVARRLRRALGVLLLAGALALALAAFQAVQSVVFAS